MVANPRPKLLLPAPEEREIRYERVELQPCEPVTGLPEKPVTQIRAEGLFGVNKQDVSHEWRLRQLRYKGIEIAYAEAVALGAEAMGAMAMKERVNQVVGIAYSTPQGSVLGMLMADIAGDALNRSRVRHGRLMDVLDAESIDILSRH